VMTNPWSCYNDAICFQNLTTTVVIPPSTTTSYVEFSYRGISSQAHYYWYDSNQLYFTVKYDGVTHQIFPQKSQFIYTQETVEDWTIFRYFFPGCAQFTDDQKCSYEITWSFVIKNLYYYSNSIGAAIDSILIVGTNGNDLKCKDCPAGYCSSSGSLSCTPCPLGSYSSTAAQPTCTACPGPLPDRARYQNIGESLPTCAVSCGPGYKLNSGSSPQCIPDVDLCYLPSRDRVMDSSHYYPTSLAMLSQCLNAYLNPPQYKDVLRKTIDSVIEMVSQYSNLTNTFLLSLRKIQSEVDQGVYQNMYVCLC
jgi:hypothetical protein